MVSLFFWGGGLDLLVCVKLVVCWSVHNSARGEIPMAPPVLGYTDNSNDDNSNQQQQVDQPPSEEYIDGLTAQPFWDVTANPSLFPWAIPLEEQAHIILVRT